MLVNQVKITIVLASTHSLQSHKVFLSEKKLGPKFIETLCSTSKNITKVSSGVSWLPQTSKMERFATIVTGF